MKHFSLGNCFQQIHRFAMKHQVACPDRSAWRIMRTWMGSDRTYVGFISRDLTLPHISNWNVFIFMYVSRVSEACPTVDATCNYFSHSLFCKYRMLHEEVRFLTVTVMWQLWGSENFSAQMHRSKLFLLSLRATSCRLAPADWETGVLLTESTPPRSHRTSLRRSFAINLSTSHGNRHSWYRRFLLPAVSGQQAHLTISFFM